MMRFSPHGPVVFPIEYELLKIEYWKRIIKAFSATFSPSSLHFSVFFIISCSSSLQHLQIFLMVLLTGTVVVYTHFNHSLPFNPIQILSLTYARSMMRFSQDE